MIVRSIDPEICSTFSQKRISYSPPSLLALRSRSFPQSLKMSNRAHALSLISQKEGLEAELQSQYDILKSHDSTMSTPLVDAEGFPRADIDIWAIRHARVRVIELQNDITAIVERIKEALEEAAAEDASATPAPTTNGVRDVNDITNGVDGTYESRPLGKVNGVAPGSPASAAVGSAAVTGDTMMTATESSLQGLQREDLVVRFGRLTYRDFSGSLQPLADLVSEYENVRGEVFLHLPLFDALKQPAFVGDCGATRRSARGSNAYTASRTGLERLTGVCHPPLAGVLLY